MESGNRQYRQQQNLFLDSNSQGKASKVDSGGTFANLLRNSGNLNSLQGQQQANYLQLANNNHALAKRNSLMMTKIAKLEKKISHLQAENMNLKRNNISDSQLRKSLLNDRLTIIEDIVHEKLSDILTAFRTTREQEGLPFRELGISSKLINNGLSENSTNRQPEDNERSKSVSSSPSSGSNSDFLNENINTDTNKLIEKQNNKKVSEKKRRSLRRQSIYISKDSLQNINRNDNKSFHNSSNQTDNYSLMENYGSTGIDTSSDSLGVNYGSHITPPDDNNSKHPNNANTIQADNDFKKHDIAIRNDYLASNIHELTPSSPSSDESDNRIDVVELPDQSNIASNYRIVNNYLEAQAVIHPEQMKYNEYKSSVEKKSPIIDLPKSTMRDVFNDDSLDKFSQIYNVSQSSMILQDNLNKGKVGKEYDTNENINEGEDINNKYIAKTKFKSESTEYEPLNIEFEDIVVVESKKDDVTHKKIDNKSDFKNSSQLIHKSDSSKRRTRGKSVNYALPSLKTKMRRPSKENEIIQVKKSKRKSLTSNNVNFAKRNRQPLKLLSNNT